MANYNILNLFVRVGGLSLEETIKANEYHEALLIVSDDEIRLDVKFPNLDKISHRMGTWNNEISYDSWGKLVVCENSKAYKTEINIPVDIDFSKSKLLNYKISTTFVSFYIDRIKYSYDYPTDKDEATFWLNDAGHKFVQDYYDVGWGIELPKRMNIEAHDILGARCYPYFDFYRTSGSNSREIIIRKTPKVKWYDFDDVESIIKYNGWICQLASLFYGNDINYTGGQIDFNGRRTVIHQILSASTLKTEKTFMFFIGLQRVCQFLDAVSFEEFKKFETYFEIIIERFIQSQNLNASSQYQVLYNILELCHTIDCTKIKENTEQNEKRKQKNKRIKKEINLIKSELEIFFKSKLETIKESKIKKEKRRCWRHMHSYHHVLTFD